MALPCREIIPRNPVLGVVVRPSSSSAAAGSNSSSSPQTLIFSHGEVRELNEIGDSEAGGAMKRYVVSEERLPVAGEMGNPHLQIYEPSTGDVFFLDVNSTFKRLDRGNAVSPVVCREGVPGRAVRFGRINALAADGRGSIFIVESRVIRVLDVRTGEVKTFRASEPVTDSWISATYDGDADVLVAATHRTVCHVVPYTQECDGVTAVALRVIAGSWTESGDVDGRGMAARFRGISSVLAGADGTIHIVDENRLRRVDGFGTVTTGATVMANQMAFLPGGQLAVYRFNHHNLFIFGTGQFLPSSEELAGWVPAAAPRTEVSLTNAASELLNHLTAPAASRGENRSKAAIVTVTTGGGKAFVAHRSALAARSEYFQRLLAEGGGFADSGTAEVALPDAHPEAFGRLLVYMYTGQLVVPDELLRPAVELAGRLLLPVDCTAQLTARLLAAATPVTAISDLIWAEQRGMAELASRLKAYLLRNRKAVAAAGAQVKEGLSALQASNPQLVVELLLQAYGA